MAPRPDLLHPRAVEILGWIPPFLRGESDNIAFAHCLARESERAEGFIEWVRDQLNPLRADLTGLAWHSRQLHLPVAPEGTDVEQVRLVVLGRVRALAGDPSERDWVARVSARLGTDAWKYLKWRPVEDRVRNEVINSSWEVDLSGWAANNAAGWAVAPVWSRVTDWADKGVASLRGLATNAVAGGARLMTFRTQASATYLIPIAADDIGKPVPAGAVTNVVNPPDAGAGNPGVFASVQYLDAAFNPVAGASQFDSPIVGVAVAGRFDLPITATPPPGSVWARMVMQVRSVAANDVVDVKFDSVRYGTYEYGDGSIAGWEWVGAAHASPSRRVHPPAQTLRIILPWQAGSAADVAARRIVREETPSELDLTYENTGGFVWDVSQWDLQAWGN